MTGEPDSSVLGYELVRSTTGNKSEGELMRLWWVIVEGQREYYECRVKSIPLQRPILGLDILINIEMEMISEGDLDVISEWWDFD